MAGESLEVSITVDYLFRKKSKRRSHKNLRKTASLNSNDRKSRMDGQRRSEFGKWSSDDSLRRGNELSSSLNRRKREGQQFELLENKVALLEKQLQDEQIVNTSRVGQFEISIWCLNYNQVHQDSANKQTGK